MRALLETGAGSSVKNDSGACPSKCASAMGDIKIVHFQIDRCTDTSLVDNLESDTKNDKESHEIS